MSRSAKSFLVVPGPVSLRKTTSIFWNGITILPAKWGIEIVSGLLYLYCRICAKTSSLRMSKEALRYLGMAQERKAPWVVTFWHEDFLLWPVAAQCPTLPWSVWIHNDTFGGRVVKGFCRRTGLPTVELPRKSSRKEKLGALLDALRSKGRIGIAADYGEPWFRVHPTASQLARQTGGVIIAMHISAPANPRVGLGRHRLRLPVPFSRYDILATSWIDPAQLGGDRQAIPAIESGLWFLQTGHLMKSGGALRPQSSIVGVPRHRAKSSSKAGELMLRENTPDAERFEAGSGRT